MRLGSIRAGRQTHSGHTARRLTRSDGHLHTRLRKLRVLLLRGAFFLIAFLAVFVRPRWPTVGTTATAVELSGYAFLLWGLTLRMWAMLYIGGRKSDLLITEGPYSICRNPLYVGSFLIAVGASLCFENLLMLAASLVVVVPIHLVAARLEEQHLAAKFPDAYPAYRSAVPRFWPRFRHYHSRSTVEVSVHTIRRVMLDTIAVLLIPAVEDLLEMLHRHHVVPVLWLFP